MTAPGTLADDIGTLIAMLSLGALAYVILAL